MIASQNNKIMQHADVIAFMFALSQIILALGLFWSLKAHIV